MATSRLAEHIRKTEEAKKNRGKGKFNNGGAGGNKTSMWHFWKPGPQNVRFVDDFLMTKTHYIGNRGKMGEGLKMFADEVFTAEQDKLPVIIPCANWDVEKEERIDGGCVVCQLNQMARNTIDSGQFDSLDDKDQKHFELLKARSDNRTHYRWNLIDRDDAEFKGFKITTVGQELFDALKIQVHDKIQPRSFCDDVEGVDVCVEKTGNADKNERVKYTASMAVDQKTLSVKQSPLNDEEQTWKKHDLKEKCCRTPDQQKIMDSLKEDVREELLAWLDQNAKPVKKAVPAETKSDFALNGGASAETSKPAEKAKKRPF